MIERLDVTARRRNPVYERFCREHVRRYEIARDWLAPFAPLVVVDAACGAGYGSEYLRPLGRYVGLDCHVGALRKARRDYPGAAFRLADLEDGRSLAECAPDAIVSLETAEHLEDPECFLAQARWALRPGGHLVFSAPTSLTRDYDPYHLRDWGEHRWQEALEAAGFRVLERRPMCFEAKFTDFLGTVPTTWAQKWSIFKFLLRNRHYRRERLREWLGRNRFSWCSHIWLCEPATEPVNP